MKLGIVGSRSRATIADYNILLEKLIELGRPTLIISGGCPVGADKFAVDIAKQCNIPIKEYLPDLRPGMGYFERCDAYYARNKKIANNSDILIAMVAKNRKGGTENTIKHFLQTHPQGEMDGTLIIL
jgi:hypothetical protein